MAAQATAQRPPEVEITESLRRDLTKQIRKLRWIGRPDEAERLELAASTGFACGRCCPTRPAGSAPRPDEDLTSVGREPTFAPFRGGSR